MGRNLWGIVKDIQTFAGAGPSPTEDPGWMSTGSGAQLTLPGSPRARPVWAGKLHTQVPPEGFKRRDEAAWVRFPPGPTPVHFLLSAVPLLRS